MFRFRSNQVLNFLPVLKLALKVVPETQTWRQEWVQTTRPDPREGGTGEKLSPGKPMGRGRPPPHSRWWGPRPPHLLVPKPPALPAPPVHPTPHPTPPHPATPTRLCFQKAVGWVVGRVLFEEGRTQGVPWIGRRVGHFRTRGAGVVFGVGSATEHPPPPQALGDRKRPFSRQI